MGRNHVRLLSAMPEADLVGVFDRDETVCSTVAAEYGALACRSIDELAGAAEALVLAIPTVAHAEIGCSGGEITTPMRLKISIFSK